MKRMILIALLLILAVPAVGKGEDAGNKLIYAEKGQASAMQIRSLESDDAVGIIGVESEPVQRRWEDFAGVFTRFMKKNWDEDIAFSDAVWSNGCWLHLCDFGYVTMQVFTTDDSADGWIREVKLIGFQKECAPDVQVLTAAAYWAAAQYGEYGKYTMQIVFMEDHSEDWFTEEPFPVWIENGYQLSYGMTDMDCPYGRIVFTEELPVTGGYAPFDPEGMENILSDLTVEDLFVKLKTAAESGPLKGVISAPVLPDTWTNVANGRIYQIVWDDCALLLYTDGDGKHLCSATLSCMSGDTVSACMHLFPLYEAVVLLETDVQSLITCLVGGHGTWEDMRVLQPFCVMNGVMLQCDAQEIGGNELPIAYICGAVEMDKKAKE